MPIVNSVKNWNLDDTKRINYKEEMKPFYDKLGNDAEEEIV